MGHCIMCSLLTGPGAPREVEMANVIAITVWHRSAGRALPEVLCVGHLMSVSRSLATLDGLMRARGVS